MRFVHQKKFVIDLLRQQVNLDKAGLTQIVKAMLTTVIYFGTITNVNTADKMNVIIK